MIKAIVNKALFLLFGSCLLAHPGFVEAAAVSAPSAAAPSVADYPEFIPCPEGYLATTWGCVATSGMGTRPSGFAGTAPTDQQMNPDTTPWNQFTPQGNQFTPQGNQFTPQGNQFTPPWNQFTPQGNQFTPQGNQFTPQGNQFTPQGNQFTPQGNQFTPPENQFTPPGNQFTPPGNQFTPPGKPVVTQGKAVATPPVNMDLYDQPPSAIEKALLDRNVVTEKAKPQVFQPVPLRQFGYSFFRLAGDSFAPQMDIPVGPDYTVGPGDTVILSAWGSLEGTFPLGINRNGEIQLPRVGPLKVWGVSIERLPTLIRSALAKVYRDFDINVTMGRLKVIKVYVVGEVNNPGDYNVSALSTVINALSAAGGPLKAGSLRNITIRRSGKIVETIDLYDFFLNGDKSRDIRLQSGDTVFVPTIGPTVGITGSVKRPAIYELREENTLKDLLKLAGGMLPTGHLQRVQISRVTAHDRKTVDDFNLDSKSGERGSENVAGSIPVRDLDLVKIFPIDNLMRDKVRLMGYVLRPGEYAFKTGMRISSLLLPDNTLPEYYREAGEITRLFPPDFHPEKIIFNPAKAITGDQRYDLELQELDTVRIFSRWDMEEMPKVSVNGEVQRPGEYRYFTNMRVRDLLLQAGNPKNNAYLKNAEINRLSIQNEKAQSQSIVINLEEVLKANPEHNITLHPFDELTVRRIPNWNDIKERYVMLSGEFVFPGIYPIYKGERLSSVISRAGGFSDKAYPRGAKFTRETVRKQQQLRMEEILDRAEEELLAKQTASMSAALSKEELDATKAALEGLQRSITLLRTKKAEGRMVIGLSTPEGLVGSAADVELVGGDELNIPPDPFSVNVLGHVYNPTAAVYVKGHDVRHYLDHVGGANSTGDEDEVYLVKADGSVFSKKQSRSFLSYNSFLSRSVDSGDTIVVPQRIEKTAWMREIKDITSILANIALSAGTIILGFK